jgi:hypothetical protein
VRAADGDAGAFRAAAEELSAAEFSSVTSSESEACAGRAPSLRVVHEHKRIAPLTTSVKRVQIDAMTGKMMGDGLTRKEKTGASRIAPVASGWIRAWVSQVTCTTRG